MKNKEKLNEIDNIKKKEKIGIDRFFLMLLFLTVMTLNWLFLIVITHGYLFKGNEFYLNMTFVSGFLSIILNFKNAFQW